MIYSNKKADMVNSMLAIIIVLVVFFMLQQGVQDILTNVIVFSPDPTITFMMSLLIPAVLIGVLKWVFGLGGSSS